MAKTLSKALETQRNERTIAGLRIAKGIKTINHSLFVDDTLLLEGASTIIARRVKKFLDEFLQVSGELLNNTKCRIYGWNIPSRTMQRISQIMEIPAQENWNHFFYLELPISKESMKAEIWTKQIEKMQEKIKNWGMMWLNMAGRVILIKALLAALPIYQYAIIMELASAHKQMELIIRSLLWQGGKQENKKFSLVKWEQVVLPYEQRALSIRLPGLMNAALGMKIVWRLITSKESWWRKTLINKYMDGSREKLLNGNIPIRQSTQGMEAS